MRRYSQHPLPQPPKNPGLAIKLSKGVVANRPPFWTSYFFAPLCLVADQRNAVSFTDWAQISGRKPSLDTQQDPRARYTGSCNPPLATPPLRQRGALPDAV
eukprot:gene22399-biopygen2728